MKCKWFLRSIQLGCLLVTLLCCFPSGAQAEGIAPGSQLAKFTMSAPDTPQVQSYLGLKSTGPFSIADVGSKVVIIEFLSTT